nr:CD225/dispanin family protein [Micromonospora sp. DSM 115978]
AMQSPKEDVRRRKVTNAAPTVRTPDGARGATLSFPPNYPPPPPMGEYDQPPFQEALPAYLWQAIAVTVLGVLCCPAGLISSGFGVAALVTSSRIAEKQRQGDATGARAASNRVTTFCVIGGGLLLAAVVFNVIYYFAIS